MERKKLRWLIGAAIIALLGCAVSVYSTLHHVEVKNYGFSDAMCNVSETFNCDDVAKSEYSEFFGIPLGVYGFGYFLGLLVLSSLTIWKKDEEYDEGPVAYKALVGIGVLSSIILGGLSWFSVGTLCLTCIAVYSLCFLQALWLVFHSSSVNPGFETRPLVNGGITALIALLVSITTYNFTLGATTPDQDGKVDNTAATQSQKPYDINIDFSPYSGLGEDYRKGGDNSEVVIVEFADFECPACAGTAKVMKKVAEEYGNKILIVFKNYPLQQNCNKNIDRPFHKFACKAAILARCAGIQGKFWEFHDAVYEDQSNISDSMLENTARKVGLSQSEIESCLKSDDILAKIKQDVDIATNIKVTGTPSVYVNGRAMQGNRTLDDFRRLIDRILNQ